MILFFLQVLVNSIGAFILSTGVLFLFLNEGPKDWWIAPYLLAGATIFLSSFLIY